MGGEAEPVLGFADCPGFGYPKLGKETKERLEETTERTSAGVASSPLACSFLVHAL